MIKRAPILEENYISVVQTDEIREKLSIKIVEPN